MKPNKSVHWKRLDPESLDLADCKVAVVGGTGGIGRAISRYLASRGASVLVVGQTFRDEGVPGIKFIKADLSLMHEAQRVASMLPAESLDLLILTTGIIAAPKREETSEGLERDMAVSYLSRLVLVRALAPRLGKSRTNATAKPRVFIVGFPGTGQGGTLGDLNAEKAYKAIPVHMNTVAGNEVLVLDAAERYPYANFFGLNPGAIKTNIRSNFLGAGTLKYRVTEALIGLLTPSVDTYGRSLAPLFVSPDLEEHSGAIFNKKGQAILPSSMLTRGRVGAFLRESEALIARTGVELPASGHSGIE